MITLTLQFWVQKESGFAEYAAGIVMHDTKFGFIAPVTDMTLWLQITTVNVDSVEVLHCSWRELKPYDLKIKINMGERVLEPFLNEWLRHKPIQFPHQLFGLFELEALTLAYYNDYVYAGISPIFIGPTSSSAFQMYESSGAAVAAEPLTQF